MQPDMRVAVVVDDVERLHPGDEQQAEVFQCPLGPPVQRGPGVVEEMAEVAIELLVRLLGHVRFRLAPQRSALIRRLVLAVLRDRYR
jgi:hypothetical protein